ncbi:MULTISPECIES: DMT family transporter [Silvimonas]|uniref:DMT family transporter n=1 Tax=Silvimonas TaxID=300264 RepID=UPI0024B3A2D3|nr:MULTISPECIES: multidrug efflux SMR transporter [Silvimonas]MDR3428260.1 multidrug efflux SMR transporter [Silvimonas sp.]
MPAIKPAWIFLGLSIFAEVIGTVGLKFSAGFSRPLPTAITIACYLSAIWLMALSTKQLEIGLAYAVWAGACTALTAVVGITWFGESVSSVKLLGLGLAIASLIVLNLSESA